MSQHINPRPLLQVPALEGEMVTDPKRLEELFWIDSFEYQFHTPTKISRVMRCTRLGELEWLQDLIREGTSVKVRLTNPQASTA